MFLVFHCSYDAATTKVPTYNNMFYFEYIHSKLNHGKAV